MSTPEQSHQSYHIVLVKEAKLYPETSLMIYSKSPRGRHNRQLQSPNSGSDTTALVSNPVCEQLPKIFFKSIS